MTKLKHNITLDIATAASSRAAKWKNSVTTWEAIAATLSETERTKETLKQYFSYTKDRQDEIKDVGGFVGGKLLAGTAKIKGKEVEYKPPYGWRRKGFVEYRQIVALDVDFGDLDVWLDFRDLNAAGLFYTTHKHQVSEPRFRIVFPLDRPVSTDEYEAIARIVASWLDIEVFDDTTYQPTRLMYYPSTAKDGEYQYDIIDAPVMVADDVLAELPGWEDPQTWPRSSREQLEIRPDHSGQVEDPEAKGGIVGAFCRAFTLDEAIAEFLEDVYTPCEELGEDRYSYIGGSTSGGLIVYDHKLAYSHHNTDPAGQKLCNAFDLVRLHKFGDLDDKVKEDTEPTKIPSYKAMADFASKLKEVKQEIIRDRREHSASDYDEIEATARAKGEAEDWVDQLETEGKSGKIKNTIANVVLILTHDEYLAGRFGYNEFEQRETAIKALPWDKGIKVYPRPLADKDDAELRLYLERCYDITSTPKIADALTVITNANSYHPVRDYLDACIWDGTERLDTLLVNIFGAEDTPYVRAVTRKWFTAAVSRVYNPGCKFDFVLIIIGEQGRGKSTLFDRMGGKWFSDSVTTIAGKEALESIQGSWIIELGELAGLRKAEVDAVKHFVAKREDRFRVAYGKRIEHFARRCVFGGTSNEDDILRDVTGNRRFWIVNVKGLVGITDVWKYLDAVTVSQLWAEARERLADGETLYLDKELEDAAREIQDDHLEKDDRTGLVADYLARLLPKTWDNMDTFARTEWLREPSNVGVVERSTVCILEVWAECFDRAPEHITRADSLAIGRILKTFRNWEPAPATRVKLYGIQKVFVTNGIPHTPIRRGPKEGSPRRPAKRREG